MEAVVHHGSHPGLPGIPSSYFPGGDLEDASELGYCWDACITAVRAELPAPSHTDCPPQIVPTPTRAPPTRPAATRAPDNSIYLRPVRTICRFRSRRPWRRHGRWSLPHGPNPTRRRRRPPQSGRDRRTCARTTRANHRRWHLGTGVRGVQMVRGATPCRSWRGLQSVRPGRRLATWMSPRK